MSSVYIDHQLTSNQEEADTKVILHCRDALNTDPGSAVILRSHSGDTDITVLSVSLLYEYKERVFLDCGCGKYKKGFWLKSIEMSSSEINALIAFHAFTGNDFVSCFFRKGKAMCWKVMKQSEKFEVLFHHLGSTWDLSEELYQLLEEYTCLLYGYKRKNINNLRSEMFAKKYTNENKVVDLSVLPPCQSVLRLHSKRANYVAKIWKSSLQPIIDVSQISEHGWTMEGQIQWVDVSFPDLVEDILLDPNFDEDFEFESDVDSDDETST